MRSLYLNQDSDEALCEQLGRAAYVEDCLFQRHIASVTRYLQQHFHGIEHEAVAAESIQTALEVVGRHRVKKSFRALLFCVAKQQGWKASQRLEAQRQRELSALQAQELASPLDMAQNVIETVALATALQRLSELERSLLLWRYVDEWSEREIAQVSGKSLSAVKSGLYHARQKLRADPNLARVVTLERKTHLKGWILSGSHAQDYAMGVAPQKLRGKHRCAFLQSTARSPHGFATMMQMFRADLYREKRVRFSGQVKIDGVEGWAGLWMRVDGPEENRSLRFDNMQNRPLQGTADWKPIEIVLDVPRESVMIALGLLLHGKGEVWVSELQLEEVGDEVPTTTSLHTLPDRPQNLAFDSE